MPDLFHDWNGAGCPGELGNAVVLDETLRDGIQSPSAIDPNLDAKVELLHLLDELGVDQLDVGLPGAGVQQRAAIKRLAEEKRDARLRIKLNVACRTVISDIAPAAELQQETGVPLEVYAFIGSSPIRQLAEAWDVSVLLRHSGDAIDDLRPFTLALLPVQPHRRIPGVVGALQVVAPVGYAAEQQPYPCSHRPGQGGNHRVNGDDQVKLTDERRRIQ